MNNIVVKAKDVIKNTNMKSNEKLIAELLFDLVGSIEKTTKENNKFIILWKFILPVIFSSIGGVMVLFFNNCCK